MKKKIFLVGPRATRSTIKRRKRWGSWDENETKMAEQAEGNLVKTFELSDEIRREGDHGSFGYRKKAVFTHRSREFFLFLRPRKGILLPQSHQSILP